MDTIKSRVSYLNGLIDGLEIKKESKEGKVLYEVVEVLKDIADELEELNDRQNDIEEYMDAVNENISFIEDDLYDEDDDFSEEDIEDFIDMLCPKCGETLYIDTKILHDKDSIVCPNCHNDIPLDLKCGSECESCNSYK
ncbi:CD1247 N-terminal domain-containing protein [Clostridium rectalis]|uniref:CD1247 N-terminal domain-containing protein n=1 Tax=Clostridium rectalis TaxID=2040295 RepID=UPI000F62ED31|nr:CD1247 N-terminal domain-containing protein [Clostridium rectalis]